MSYKLVIPQRKAVCKDCKEKIGEFEPRIDQERDGDDVPEGQEGAGWRTRRLCLSCGITRMELDLQEMREQYSRASNVWNLISKRKKWQKRVQKEFSPNMRKCTCGEMACELTKVGKKILYLCPKGHFVMED
jgi:hypothetical protein